MRGAEAAARRRCRAGRLAWSTDDEREEMRRRCVLTIEPDWLSMRLYVLISRKRDSCNRHDAKLRFFIHSIERNQFQGHSRSFEMTHLSRVCLSPYLYFVVTMSVSRTVSTILRVKEWQDLEIWVLGRSRSLKLEPFDRSYTTYRPGK